ncbi:hypothetical protein STXM2123_1817 [Streptomyces sp. F-3]|nr:hypothetical protein STXM2123_1817 [Streptomyces sp. F-3]
MTVPTPALDGTEQLFFEPFADLFSTSLESPHRRPSRN